MINWEGAELCYYYDDETRSISLSNMQFAIITKILGLEISEDENIICFSDETLKKFTEMRGNPLRLIERKN